MARAGVSWGTRAAREAARGVDTRDQGVLGDIKSHCLFMILFNLLAQCIYI